MAEPLKNLYTRELVEGLGREIVSVWAKFDSAAFVERVFSDSWDELELKGRMARISETLHCFLPKRYKKSLGILLKVAPRFEGFQYMFFPDFVEKYGMDEYDLSVAALEVLTERFSGEFAVRPFIVRYPKRMMAQMKRWASSKNEHVRRLASEGCRPRLPWAMALPVFKADPAPVLAILKKLKADESEYVRRSVANNLNDISKDNPETIIEIARSWLGKREQTDRLIKHACRTLLKRGDSEVLGLFGYQSPRHVQTAELVVAKAVDWGGSLEFSFVLRTSKDRIGKLRIEYGIDFMKSNGRLSRTIFKISESDFRSREKQVVRRHPFKPISTRKYYAGAHGIAIILNGEEVASGTFELVM